ncbi:MAG: hypothetical protein AAGB93_00090 [Planctomycetota bacterium]
MTASIRPAAARSRCSLARTVLPLGLLLAAGCGGGCQELDIESTPQEDPGARASTTNGDREPGDWESGERAESEMPKARPEIGPEQPERTEEVAAAQVADGSEAPAAPAGAAQADEFEGWATYRHPLGATFRHPADWRVQDVQTGLLLLPPDHDMEREMIAVMGSDAQGVTDPADPRVGQTLDAMVLQTAPGFRRKGRPGSVPTAATAGASYDYVGKMPDGRRAKCRIYVAVAEGAAVSFTVLAESARFRKRAETVERMFRSLHDGRKRPGANDDERPAGAPPGEVATNIDPRLVGVFSGEAISSSSGMYINTQLVWAFNADGTVLYGAQSHMNTSERDYNGNLKWTANGQSDGSVDQGRWSASGGVVSFQWSDGSASRFAYGFEPDGTLAVRNAVTRKLINIYSRVR